MGILDVFRKKKSIQETSPDEWCEKGNSLGSQGQYEESIACLEKALKIDPKHALTWFNMGLSLMNLGKKENAIEAFNEFLKYAPPEAKQTHVPVAQNYIQMMKSGAGVTSIKL